MVHLSLHLLLSYPLFLGDAEEVEGDESPEPEGQEDEGDQEEEQVAIHLQQLNIFYYSFETD